MPDSVLQSVIVPNAGFLNVAKVMNPKGCSIEQDKSIRESVLVMKGDPSLTRVQLPREDRPLSSLHLQYSLVVLQVHLSAVEHFAVEFTLTQSAVLRMKLIIGTHIKEAKHELALGGMPTAKLPLIIPRNKWVQVVFHVAGIVGHLFGLSPVKSIDSIAVAGTAKVSRVMTSNDEQVCIDATPEGMALFAVPAYAPPIWSTASKVVAEGAATTRSAVAAAPQHPDVAPASTPPENPSARNRIHSSGGTGSPNPSRGISLPARLQPLDTAGDSDSGRPRRLASAPHDDGSVRREDLGKATTSSQSLTSSTNEYNTAPLSLSPHTSAASTNARLSKATYIRLVDEIDGPQPPPLARNTNFISPPPRRNVVEASNSAKEVPPLSGDVDDLWNDVRGWDCDDSVASPSSCDCGNDAGIVKDDKAGRVAKSKPGNASFKKKKVAQPNSSTKNRKSAGRQDSDGLSEAALRRRRAKRRMQMMKANEQKNGKSVSKCLHASEIPVNNQFSQDEAAGEDAQDVIYASPEPKYGYGFGYLGVLREDGEYEVDEAADLKMKGALSLQLSDEYDGDE